MTPKSEILLQDNQKKITRFHITPTPNKEVAIHRLEALVSEYVNQGMEFIRFNAVDTPFEILILEEKNNIQ